MFHFSTDSIIYNEASGNLALLASSRAAMDAARWSQTFVGFVLITAIDPLDPSHFSKKFPSSPVKIGGNGCRLLL